MMWRLKYQDAVEEGRAEGRAEGWTDGWNEGWVEGWTEVTVYALRNLMKNTSWPLEQAMAALGISKADQPRLIRSLKEDETQS